MKTIQTLLLCLFTLVFSQNAFANEFEEQKLIKNSAYQAALNDHIPLLKNLSVANSPKFVVFSGAPGMGKTTLSRRLEDELHALRIGTDDIRAILAKHGMVADAKIPGTKMTYLSGYLVNLAFWLGQNSPNKLWVIDASMDRNFDEMANFAKMKKSPIFLIRMVCPKETALSRLQNSSDAEFYLPQFEGWWTDYSNFKKKADFTFDNSGSQVYGDLSALESAILKKK